VKIQKLSMAFFVLVALLAATTVVCGQTVSELRAHVEYLASDDLEGRQSASEGMEKAIEYVRDAAKELGLATYSQPVKVRGGTCNNLIAVLEGYDTETRIVVGAHLDHIGSKEWGNKEIIYNGADDNASGSAAVLGLAARLKAAGKPACTIEFHWYTGEEQGLLGSKVYCKKPLEPIDQYRFMLNLDMVGKLDKRRLIGEEGFPFNDVFDPLYSKYKFAEDITWTRNTNDSDHASWWRAGVPAAILHTGLHSDYHQGGDESDRINYAGMAQVCNYAYAIIQGVDAKIGPDKPVVEPVDDDPFILY